jgi:hypothetical protein
LPASKYLHSRTTFRVRYAFDSARLGSSPYDSVPPQARCDIYISNACVHM